MRHAIFAICQQATLRLAALLLLLFPAGGCLHPAHSRFFVPSRCLKVTVESFTRPCTQLADGKLLCNAVVVSASCIQEPPKSAAKLQTR